MGQSLSDIHLHLVWSTEHRRPHIIPEIRSRLYSYMGGVARERRCVLISAGGIHDHVYVLVELHPAIAPADLVRDIKANSSRFARRELRVPEFAWQSGYGTFAVSHAAVPRLKRYIANQEKHHARKTFQEEYLEMLNRAGKKFDERYIWA